MSGGSWSSDAPATPQLRIEVHAPPESEAEQAELARQLAESLNRRISRDGQWEADDEDQWFLTLPPAHDTPPPQGSPGRGRGELQCST